MAVRDLFRQKTSMMREGMKYIGRCLPTLYIMAVLPLNRESAGRLIDEAVRNAPETLKSGAGESVLSSS